MASRKKRKDDEVAALASAMAEEAMMVWRVMSWTKNEAVPVFGAPTKCPECGAFGLVIKVDSRAGTARNRCTECSLEFILTERAIDAVAAGRMPMPPGIMLPGHAAKARKAAELEADRAPSYLETDVYTPPAPDPGQTYQTYGARADEVPAPARRPVEPLAYPPAAALPADYPPRQPEQYPPAAAPAPAAYPAPGPIAYPPAAAAPQQPQEPIAYPPAAAAPQQPQEPIAYPPAAAAPQQPQEPIAYPPAAAAPQQPQEPIAYPPAAAAPQQPQEPIAYPPAASTYPPAEPAAYPPAAYPPAEPAAYPPAAAPQQPPAAAAPQQPPEPIAYPPAAAAPQQPPEPIAYPPAAAAPQQPPEPIAYPPAAAAPQHPIYPPADPRPAPAAYPPAAAAYPAAPIEYPPAQPIAYPHAEPADPAAYPPAAAASPVAYPPAAAYPPAEPIAYPPAGQAPAADAPTPSPAAGEVEEVAPPVAAGPPPSGGPARPGAAPRANRHGASRHHRHQAPAAGEPTESLALDADLAPRPGDIPGRPEPIPISQDPLLSGAPAEPRPQPTAGPEPEPEAAPEPAPAPAALEPRRVAPVEPTPEPAAAAAETPEVAPPGGNGDSPLFPLAPRVSLLNQPPSIPARDPELPEPAAAEPLPTLPERGAPSAADVVARSKAANVPQPATPTSEPTAEPVLEAGAPTAPATAPASPAPAAEAPATPEPAPAKSGSLFSAPKPVIDDTPPPSSGPSRNRPLRVLLVEDDPTDAAVVEALLSAAGPDVIDLRVASTRERGQAVAGEEAPDIVLLDLDLPDSHGLATITRWIFAGLPGRVIVMSGDYSPELVERGKEQGVTEFVHKRHLMQLLQLGEEGTIEIVRLLNEIADSPEPSTANH